MANQLTPVLRSEVIEVGNSCRHCEASLGRRGNLIIKWLIPASLRSQWPLKFLVRNASRC